MQQATCVTYMSRTLTLAASDLRAVLHVTFSHAYYSSYEHTIKRAECEPRIFDPAGELRVSHRCFGLSRQTHHRPIEWFDAELLPHEARMIQTANSINWHPENESVLMVLTSPLFSIVCKPMQDIVEGCIISKPNQPSSDSVGFN